MNDSSHPSSNSAPKSEAQDCPADDVLLEIIVEARDSEASRRIESHLEQCERCQQRLENLSGNDTVSSDLLKTSPAERSEEFDAFLNKMQARGALSLAGAITQGASIPPTDPDDFSGILDAPSRPGTIGMLGDYDIVEKVAAGGMGVVFKARDRSLNRTVAIKVLRTEQAGMNDARERFVREARAAAGLDHENILPIYHVDHEAKAPFLVMPFIDGNTLEQVMQANDGAPLPPDEIQRITRQVAGGLAVAHDRGLIHRDIKPANILVESETNRVWIADFGLARAVWDPSLTQSGSLTGTPLFMSPEQAGDEPVDARSDLFSLGSVLYYLATAKLPFTGARSLSVLRKVRDEEPMPVREVNPGAPAWLASLIARLMQKDPADRPQSAEEIVAMLDHPDIETFTRSSSSAAPTKKSKERRSISIWMASCGALAGAAAVGIAVYGTFFRPERLPTPPPLGSGLPAAAEQPLVFSILRRNGNRDRSSSFTDALRLALPGDVIELSSGGKKSRAFTTAPIRLDREVNIRAAKGSIPVIECHGTLFTTGHPLRLEGLVLRNTAANTEVISTTGRELIITNCQIENIRHTPDSPRQSRLINNPVLVEPLIRCISTSSISIRNSQLVSSTTLLSLQPGKNQLNRGTKILFGNCILDSTAGLTIELARDVDFHMKRCFARTDHHLLTLHRNPRSRQDGKCTLRLSLNAITSGGPMFGFGNSDIVDSVTATFDRNAWNSPNVWSGGIFRRQNADLVTRDHRAFMGILESTEVSPVFIKGTGIAQRPLKSAIQQFPARRRPDPKFLGPGEPYETFKASPLYDRTARQL